VEANDEPCAELSRSHDKTTCKGSIILLYRQQYLCLKAELLYEMTSVGEKVDSKPSKKRDLSKTVIADLIDNAWAVISPDRKQPRQRALQLKLMCSAKQAL